VLNPQKFVSKEKETGMASNVIVRSVSGERFTQMVETGKHQLFGDEPELFGGSDRGPGPYEYLLVALGT
jgi:putative redox protein